MMTFLLFAGTAILLTVEGRWMVRVIAGGNFARREEWLLGFPLAAFSNALVFFLCTILRIPLTASIIFGFHVVILLSFGIIVSSRVLGRVSLDTILSFHFDKLSVRPKSLGMTRPSVSRDRTSKFFITLPKILIILFCIAVLIKLFFATSHALLPTFYYDSVSQWTMRSEISFHDHAIAFDREEPRGMSKPQYPILFHSLQIFFMLPQGEWIDAVANISTLLLSLTSFLACFFILARLRGYGVSLLAFSFILTIPLLSLHLSQGYGDIHVLTYLLLAAISFLVWFQKKDGRALLLASLFIVASSFVKQEGLVFGVLPFIFLLLLLCGIERSSAMKILRMGVLPSLLGFLWSVFLIIRGLPLSPHGGNDLAISFHPEAVRGVFSTLFASGSFGIHWYVLFALLLFFGFTRWRNAREGLPALFLVLWGLLLFFETLFIYLFTSNVKFLLNEQTFSRTMLLVLPLLLLGTVLLPAYTSPHDAS